MKKRILRRHFNMIEVMLAIVIIAIGMASTFVLFPVGLNANKQAMAENSISDLAEYVTAFVRAESQDSDHMNDSSSLSFKSGKYCTATEKAAIEQEEAFKNAVEVENPSDSDWKSVGSDDKVLLKHRSKNGVYLVRQLSGSSGNQLVDFSAIAMVYLDVSSSNTSGYDNEYFPALTNHSSNTAGEMHKKYSELPNKTNSNFNVQKFLLPLVLEISWPADVPLSEREKRYFRFELFNGQYVPDQDTRTSATP